MIAATAASGFPVGILVLQVIAFAVVFWAVWAFVIKRVKVQMASREQEIRKAFEDIEAKQAEAERMLQEHVRKMKEIELEAAAKMKEALAEGERLRAELEAEAHRRAEAELTKARALIRIESDQALVMLRRDAARLALDGAERIVAQRLDAEMQSRLVERYLKEIEKVDQV